MTQSGPLDERRAALAARFPAWEPMTLDARLDRCAAEFGDRPLVITDEATATYAQVAARATELADGLAALGIGPGDRVGLVMANVGEFVPLKFAVARVGAVAIPFNYLYRTEELRYVLAQSGCHALVTMTGFAGLDHTAMLDEIAPGWDAGVQTALPELREVVLLEVERPVRTGVRTVDDLAALGREHPGGADAAPPVSPHDVADILYTSGTTGSPKGVLITHDAVQRTGYASARTRAMEDGRRILFSLPCYHMFGYVEGLVAAMMVGGAVVLQSAFDPGRYLEGIERHRATDILCVPTMTVALLEHPDLATRDLSSLTAVLSGAAPAPVWLWERVRAGLGVDEIVTGYGMTEQGGAMTLTRPEDPLELMSTTVGRVKDAGVAGLADHSQEGVQQGALIAFRTADVETGELLGYGEEGELVAHGPTGMLGFWRKPEETAEAIRPDGRIRSGDLGVAHADGTIVLTGRSKELYKSGGELVMPKEVEEVLSRHPAVSQAYAVGVADERWGEIGVACVVARPGGEVTEGELIDLCRAELARFKVPKRVLFLAAEELPTTPTGKVQKFRLARRAAEEVAAAQPSTAEGHPPYDAISLAPLAFWARSPAEREEDYAVLRRERPVSWHPPAEGSMMPPAEGGGFWAVTSHALVGAVSKDPETFCSGEGIQMEDVPPDILEAVSSFLAVDAPRHTKLRRLVSSAFTPKRVKRIEEQIRDQARRLVDHLIETGDGDFVEHVSRRLPQWTIFEMVGLEDAETRELATHAADGMVSWGDEDVRAGREPAELLAESLTTLIGVALELAEARRAEPRDDLMTNLVQAEVDGERLTDDEIAAFFCLLSIAGNDTTRNTISSTMRQLTVDRDQRALLVEDFDGRIDVAVEEFVRWASPVMTFRRTATRDVELGGAHIRRGDWVVMFYAAANADPEVFADPRRFDVTRNPNPHVGFGGGGPHFCLGNQLAKAQLRAIFRELLARVPDIEAGEPVYLAGNFMQAVKSMPCRLHL